MDRVGSSPTAATKNGVIPKRRPRSSVGRALHFLWSQYMGNLY